ncbi:MAG: hypothetical protein ACRENF_05345 [Thermodesulfobacteriota bacterium]
MTKLLEKAFAKIQKLPKKDQDSIAQIILDEIEDEKKWDEAFAKSQHKLSKIAEKVRADIKAGRTRKIGIDQL